jgi:hypothetical protein
MLRMGIHIPEKWVTFGFLTKKHLNVVFTNINNDCVCLISDCG